MDELKNMKDIHKIIENEQSFLTFRKFLDLLQLRYVIGV